MIDHLDKQTQTLPLEQKRGRGRPATGQALSNAERQKIYRERQKAQRNEKSEKHAVPYDEVVAIAQELGERCKKAEARVKELEAELRKRTRTIVEQARMIQETDTKLAQRNENPSRLNEGMQKIIRDVHEVADAIEGSTWRIQRKRGRGAWRTQAGKYRSETEAVEKLMDMEPCEGATWRVIEVKSEFED